MRLNKWLQKSTNEEANTGKIRGGLIKGWVIASHRSAHHFIKSLNFVFFPKTKYLINSVIISNSWLFQFDRAK